jgi:hypothetical protein
LQGAAGIRKERGGGAKRGQRIREIAVLEAINLFAI